MKMLREQKGSQEGLEIDTIFSLILAVDFFNHIYLGRQALIRYFAT